MDFFERKTGKKLAGDRNIIIRAILSPIYNKFMLQSDLLNATVEQYKDEQLKPYVMTERDKVRLVENPDYINDIPRYQVRQFDKVVSDCRFDQKVRNEFFFRYRHNDVRLMNFINDFHPDYCARIDSVKAVG